jgi:TonB family protein
MKKSILFSALFLFSVFAYCQKDNSVKNYQLGSKALEDKRYADAISFLSLSIDENPTANAYFNRSVAFYYLSDTCNFCADLANASDLNDTEAKKIYVSKCHMVSVSEIIPDSLKAIYPEIKFIRTIHKKCYFENNVIYIYEDSNNVSLNGKANSYSSDIFDSVQEMPSFKGGQDSLDTYLANHVKYPKLARDYGISGITSLRFVVNQNGEISDVKVYRGIGGGCDEEAFYAIRSMPKWNPGKQNGIPVRVYCNIEVKFGISDRKKTKR